MAARLRVLSRLALGLSGHLGSGALRLPGSKRLLLCLGFLESSGISERLPKSPGFFLVFSSVSRLFVVFSSVF